MTTSLWSWRASLARIWIAAAALLLTLCATPSARADQSTFHTYDASQGLTSLGGACMVQDGAGYILVCTEHGVFAYDGRRFINLGAGQGLREGGDVYSIAFTQTGRLAVTYADEVFVSDQPPDQAHPPSSLWFQPVSHPGLSFFAARGRRLAPWQGGFALIAGDLTVRVVVPAGGPAYIEPLGYTGDDQRLLEDALSMFSIRGQLWETFLDGRICRADPGSVSCQAVADGGPNTVWQDVVAGPDGGVLARSASAVAAFEPGSGRWSVTELPDQGGRYVNYASALALFTDPDGRLVTQADHGLATLGPQGWRLVTVAEGAPSGIVTSAMTDATGQLWFQVFGRGLVRWVGYGRWETVQKAEGLSEGIPWQTARPPGGSVWATTDSGVDEVVRDGSSLRVSRVLPGGSFAIAVGPRGQLWRGSVEGARVVDPADGAETVVEAPVVNSIAACPDDAVWLGTQAGLFGVDARAGAAPRAVLRGSPKPNVVGLMCDGMGGVLYLASGRLRHMRPGGRDATVSGPWPGDGFEPTAMAAGHDGGLWIGGEGGLYRFVLSGDRVASYAAASTSDTRSNGVVAVMVDHRGWVWAGTALGVSVFDGRRWVSIDADSGLASDDVDQDGIREDPDGSIWITTTRGLSHLLDPGWLFAERPLKVVVSGAALGARPVAGHRLPYTEDALSLQFGTPSYGAERSVVFRYQLSGVDAGPVESASGLVRYAFVPPGRHVLTVAAYDALTHQSSPAETLVVDVGYPWWRQSWAEALWVVGVVGLVHGAMRLRFRAMSARQAELKRLVLEATEQLRRDSLTGLLNRHEIERRMAEKLACAVTGEELTVALIDIDHFKSVNDSCGHLGGDDVLRAMGRLVSKALRPGECAGRYGGEEILLVLDDSDGCGAERVLALHHVVRGSPFSAAGRSVRITCSIGVTWAARGDDWDSLVARADDGLYEAKASGRDRVVERLPGIQVVRGAANERRSSPTSR